jgi:hypothetical protein
MLRPRILHCKSLRLLKWLFFVRTPDLIKKRKEKAALNGSRDSDAGKDDDL